jgi:hypothetical protein
VKLNNAHRRLNEAHDDAYHLHLGKQNILQVSRFLQRPELLAAHSRAIVRAQLRELLRDALNPRLAAPPQHSAALLFLLDLGHTASGARLVPGFSSGVSLDVEGVGTGRKKAVKASVRLQRVRRSKLRGGSGPQFQLRTRNIRQAPGARRVDSAIGQPRRNPAARLRVRAAARTGLRTLPAGVRERC